MHPQSSPATPQQTANQQEQQTPVASRAPTSPEVKYFDILTSMLALAQDFAPPVHNRPDRKQGAQPRVR